MTIEIDPATKRMVRKGLTHKLNPAAASAVEEGLRQTEKHGGSVGKRHSENFSNLGCIVEKGRRARLPLLLDYTYR